MVPGGEEPFAVGQLPEVLRRVRELTEKAAILGVGNELFEAVTTVMAKLRTDPVGSGDPDYHPKKPGSCVYHIVNDPLYFRYAVYEIERVVLILEIKPLPDSSLE